FAFCSRRRRRLPLTSLFPYTTLFRSKGPSTLSEVATDRFSIWGQLPLEGRASGRPGQIEGDVASVELDVGEREILRPLRGDGDGAGEDAADFQSRVDIV